MTTTETTPPARVNVMDYAGKPHMLRVLGEETEAFFKLLNELSDEQWLAQTPCVEWQVRDLVGHMVDVTEDYLTRWAIARNQGPAPDVVALTNMATKLDEDARRFRDVSRPEMIARLRRACDGLNEILDRLDADQWTGELVTHGFMGPLPAFFYPAFQLMDYAVHGWDARQAVGKPAPLSEDAAGTLVPFMFILMQYTVEQAAAAGLATTCGIKVSGPYGGTWRATIENGTFAYEEGPIDDCPVRFSFDANDFVLTAFQRQRGGVVEGDPALAERFRSLFFTI
jgi:uncharacterized protein (TIGR03083 family)